KGVDRVVVATDDGRIRDHAATFGAEVVMTSPDCQNGTERCAEAMAHLGGTYEMVVNLQGDAPLTPAWFVEDLIAGLRAHPEAEVATPVLRTEGAALNGFLEDRRAGRVGGTTAVFGVDRNALYFSKEVIPYTGKTYADDDETPVFHHVGVYAYRPEALIAYPAWQAGPLEKLEGLEQLRFLERGRHVLCVEVEAKGRQFWELNNPEDVPRIEAMLAKMGQV
ncbi:MAG: 3-deoxy-manno-octulosonate cytidylyltransferase, partial [Rhodobacteraceae bacterium]|nr:3-deoxy-manno-octulosonate cytidylyltransferase [Paracoccaceae bacterium]